MHQQTVRQSISLSGVGVHTGQRARLRLHPAPVDSGIVFRLGSGRNAVEIPARSQFVCATSLSTSLGRGRPEVETVEHLLSALAGLGIDNTIVEMQGVEVPIMDGSAWPFVTRLLEVGKRLQPAPRRYIRILRPVVVEEQGSSAGFYPATGQIYSAQIDFGHPAVGTQALSLVLTPQTYATELARARTFGFEEELQALRQKGRALGASLENVVGLGRDGSVLNPEGLRYADEFVRHKILDAIGDLALAGHPILGEYRGIRPGHSLNLKLLQALAVHESHWELVSAPVPQQAQAV